MLYNNNVLKEIGWRMKRDEDMKHLVSLLFSHCCSLLGSIRGYASGSGILFSFSTSCSYSYSCTQKRSLRAF